MVFVFHHPLNPHGMGSPCECCCGQYEKMRDCWPSSSEAQLKNYPVPPTAVTPAPPHHSNQADTQSVRLYEQMFPGGNFWPLTLRSNRGLRGLCAQVHMCSCAHCNAVFLLSSIYVFGLNKTLGIGECFLFALRLLVSLQHLKLLVGGVLSPRCLCYRHVSSTLLTGVLPTDYKLWDLFNTQITAPLFLFSSLSLSHAPVSLPPELSAGISSPSAHPCVYAPA